MASTNAADVVAEAHRLFTFIRTPAGEVHAVPRAANIPRVALSVAQVAADVAAAFFVTGDIPGPQVMAAAMTVLSAQARQAPVREVYLRMAHIEGRSYLDLGRPDGSYVEIGPDGWAVRYPLRGDDESPALFYRPASLAALPVPEHGGSPDPLRELLALDVSDPRWRTVWGWLVAQCLPHVARPFLWLLGSQGSGKTTRGLLVANVLEPQDEMGGVLKRSERENNPVAKSSFLLTADNMTKLSEDVSNWLCSLVTGLRVVERKLYTNDETVVYSLKRSGIFTGKILPTGLQDDAVERMLVIEFDRITLGTIRGDDELLADLREAHPGILGALLSDMSNALRILPSVASADVERFRFVAYARMHVALDRHYRLSRRDHLRAIVDASTNTLTERVFEEPDLIAVLRVVAAEGGTWAGTATEMHEAMQRWRPADADGRPDRGAWWPPNARSLSTRLRNQQHALVQTGLRLEFMARTAGSRQMKASLSEADVIRWSAPASIADIESTLRGGK